MIALFTETFETFLERNEQTDEWKAVVELMSRFPTFTLGGLDYNMYELLRQKYDIYEIGSEDEQIFYFNFRNKVNELLVKYVPKIQMFISNFANALERKVNLGQEAISEQLLYPISTESGQTATAVKANGSKEQLLMIFKSNAELLEQALNLKDIYLDCLQEFETCFLMLY